MNWQDWCVAAIVAIAVALAVRRLVVGSRRRGSGCDGCEVDCPLRDTARGGAECPEARKK